MITLTKTQWATITTKIMAIPDMQQEPAAGFIIDEAPARELHRTHFRFTSDRGEADNHNGNTFAQYMRDHGVLVEQRRPKMVTIANAMLVKTFCE